ncbi:unnamed protein product [Malus baccata var. baccata]
MANLAKLDYAALDITRKNYLTWANAMIFIRRHHDEALKSEYLTVEDSLTLWNALRSRYNHQTTVILPRARYEWTHLRIQDFKSVSEYNSALFRITSQLKLYRDTIMKTFTTNKANNLELNYSLNAVKTQPICEILHTGNTRRCNS